MDHLEVRTLDGLRAVTDGDAPRLVGYAVRTGVLSEDLGGFREVIAPSAVAAALAAGVDVVALRNHDPMHVLGRQSAKTLKLEADDQGLRFEITPPESERGLVESVQRGDLTGASFRFSDAVDTWDLRTSPPTRTITSMRIYEISAGAVWPAYKQTHVAALRSLERAQEPPMPEPVAPPVVDPVPPVPPAVSPEHRDVEVVGEERFLKPGDSYRAFIERQGKAELAYKALGMGALMRAMITGPRNALERRALAEGTDSAGGVTVPEITLARFYDLLRAAVVVNQAGATTIPLTTDKTTIAKLATDPVAEWRAENANVAVDDPTFAGVVFTPRSLAVIVKASREVIEDSLNIEQMLELALVRSIAVEVDRVALMGSGTPPEPQGLFGTSGIGSESMGDNGAAFTSTAGWSKIIDTVGKVEDANASVTAMVMAPRTQRSLAKLQGSDEHFQAPPAAVAGIPRLRTTAIPVNVTQGTAEDTSWILLGDWQYLLLGLRSQLRIEVLRELFAGNLQYGYLAHLRLDVAVAHPAAFAKLIGIKP